MTTHSSVLAWRILWTEEPGRLEPTGLQRARHDKATKHEHVSTWDGLGAPLPENLNQIEKKQIFSSLLPQELAYSRRYRTHVIKDYEFEAKTPAHITWLHAARDEANTQEGLPLLIHTKIVTIFAGTFWSTWHVVGSVTVFPTNYSS